MPGPRYNVTLIVMGGVDPPNMADEDTEEYLVDFWVDAECTMYVDATSEEEAIEEAKKSIDEYMHYGTVSPAGDPSNFQARKTN